MSVEHPSAGKRQSQQQGGDHNRRPHTDATAGQWSAACQVPVAAAIHDVIERHPEAVQPHGHRGCCEDVNHVEVRDSVLHGQRSQGQCRECVAERGKDQRHACQLK